jgi:biopolymer transport protein TolR
MGFQMGDSEGGSSSSYFGKQAVFADINITPFVDVILVLLIIFMVTAPFAVSGVNVNLPQSRAKPLKLAGDPLVLSVTADGSFFLGKAKVAERDLVDKIKAGVGSDKDAALYIRADKTVPYARVMEAMGAAQAAGVARIGMMGESRAGQKK